MSKDTTRRRGGSSEKRWSRQGEKEVPDRGSSGRGRGREGHRDARPRGRVETGGGGRGGEPGARGGAWRSADKGDNQRGAWRGGNGWEGAGVAERGGERGGMRGGGGGGRGERGGMRGGGGGGRGERGGMRGGGGGGRGERGGRSWANGLGYRRLEELSTKDPSELAISLSLNPGLFALLQEERMRKDLIEVLCLVLSKAFKSQSTRSSCQHLADTIKDSGFFRTTLLQYLGGMVSESDPARRARYPQHLENVLAVISKVLNIFPASSVLTVSVLLPVLQASINGLRASGVSIPPEVEETVKNLQDMVTHLQERSREGTLRSDKDMYALLSRGGNNPDEEDLEDFRTIPIYPTPEEFQEGVRPFLRPNLTSQRYSSAHIYLDTHFRLLREDFVRPLREGVQQFLQSQMDGGTTEKQLKAKRFDDIRVYFDTQVVAPKCTHSGIAYTVQFDVEPLKFVRWENSKRLLFGSLVCLSSDHFESFLYAVVSDRDPKELQKGRVQLRFTEESRIRLAQIEKDQLFLMVETTAYFEAYRYVLDGLQEQEEDDLPFGRYIVECSKDVLPPAYLQRNDTYNLSAVADPRYAGSLRPFHSLEAEAWPAMEKLGLDESQMQAFQLALTKELAIIQGPPGTGKTYVGLKIAEALLTNMELWGNRMLGPPMLVVCYTNHALDQFLEGIHKFLKHGIVRVGGRSNSEILKHFNLRELTRTQDFKRSLPGHLRTAHTQVYDDLHDAEKEITEQSTKLECSLKGVLRDVFLREFIWDTHWRSLHQFPVLDEFQSFHRERHNMIMEWLGLGSTVFLQREPENVERYQAAAAAAEELEEDEDLIEIAEEADLIQAERFIEDNWDFRDIRDARRREDMEEAVREAEDQMLAMNLDKDEIQAEEGWEMQRDQKKKMKNNIRKELGKSSAMTQREERNIWDVWMLSLQDRWRLYRLWVLRYRVEIRNRLLRSEQTYQDAADRLTEVKQQVDLSILRRAKVIGMTTTGAAKFRTMLQAVRPRVVIVEEAAEVLEAHTITTLSRACQHLILIGDHQQLRPSATVYDLAKNFNLEMSMFERLVKMGLPFVKLNYQHRMRPDIARLLTPHIYSELENHPSVLDYENIKGLNHNLFFLEHTNLEEEIKDGKSHQNRHEATFVVALCRYLLLQGYKPEQITILTTYTGQLFCLRNLMPAKEFSGVKVHVVDKYQGEENDIVLLSLVRSNRHNKVGFLNIPNRVCVALSRAKKGLYCFGNSALLSQVPLWSNIFHTLRQKDQVGKALTLCCQNHPDRQVEVSSAEGFKQAPEGGCTQPCQFRLDCGHVCTRVCHPYDPEHKEYKCDKECQATLCDEGHKCPLVCHQKCPKKCPVRVQKIVPQCQHPQMIPCHQDPSTFPCQMPCPRLLQCGHPCGLTCGVPCSSKCQVKVTLQLKCGHSQEGACFYKTHPEGPQCKTPCKHQLKCGHTCRGTCGRCLQGVYHASCSHQCKRLLICSHSCREPCTRDCPPCQKPCENCCVHSKCMRPCGQPCAPCREPCAWKCPHLACSKLCHEPCDRPPCIQPCANTLKCGHPCIGLCGDKCPSKCRICDHDEVTEIFFGTEDDPDAYFIQLEDCGHIFEYRGMDTYMGLDDDNHASEGEQVAIKLKECPRCRTPVRKNLRYGSQINRSLREIEMVKEKINGQQSDIDEYRMTLKKQWRQNLRIDGIMKLAYLPEKFGDIFYSLDEKYVTAKDLWILENKMDFQVKITKLLKLEKERMLSKHACTFQLRFEEFERWLSSYQQRFSEQQVYDLERELCRLNLLAELNVRCHTAGEIGPSAETQSEVQQIRDVLEKLGQFTEQDESNVKDAMKRLDGTLPIEPLGITEEEKKMIVSAMNMRPGHWYKCPNGHVYVITECGGAMESRTCPDCDAVIGGTSHTLASGNQVATEMDGSQHPAWSEANNLLNFMDLNI